MTHKKKHFPFHRFSKKRPQKAAVQAFLDRQNHFQPCLVIRTICPNHYLGAGSAFLARAFYLALAFCFSLLV